MTDPMQDERITFKLWNPVTQLAGSEKCIEMDVTTIGDFLLNKGDRKTATSFAEAVGEVDPEVTSWSVEKFCSQFYSYYPDHSDWRGRFPIAWRFKIHLLNSPSELGYGGWGPFGVNVWDSTFLDNADARARGREECIVIAETRANSEISQIEELGYELHSFTYSLNAEPLTQIRIRVGRLHLPRQLDVVESVLHACRESGMRIIWSDDFPQPLH